ncbi:MAG TPA: oxidoreductase [Gemmatimonadales bacterium]|jgi:scyllo-inositol 2-dehydrogenase (NADP+)|nr:oxidoreductase [Gemmatimonadales bacterium]
MLNVGLVGFGFAGKVFHAPVIRAVEGLRLAAIVQRSGGSAPDPRYADVEFVRSVDELLARAIDLVVIATPNTSHHPIAKQCLLAGRHVVIDKPFAPTLAEAQDLVELAQRQQRVLSVYQNRRYVGDFVTLQRLVSEGALGRIVVYESHFDRFRPDQKPGAWRERAEPGAGVWFDIGPHLLDQAFVLFGTPHAIAGDIRIERDGGAVDDAFDVTLHYPTLRAVLRASMLAAAPGPSFAVHGTRGSFIKYGVDAQEAALKAGRTPGEPDWDADPPALYGTLTTPDGTRAVPTIPSSYTRYYENVRDAILRRAELAVTPEQALNIMRGLELGVASSRRRCVLPW